MCSKNTAAKLASWAKSLDYRGGMMSFQLRLIVLNEKNCELGWDHQNLMQTADNLKLVNKNKWVFDYIHELWASETVNICACL
jgi:hypothetical protein